MSENERAPFIDEAERLRILHQQEYPDYKYRPKKRQRSGEDKEKERREKGERSVDPEKKKMRIKEEKSFESYYQVPSPISSRSYGPTPSPVQSYTSPTSSLSLVPSPLGYTRDDWAEQIGHTPPGKVPSSPTFPFSPNNVSKIYYFKHFLSPPPSYAYYIISHERLKVNSIYIYWGWSC